MKHILLALSTKHISTGNVKKEKKQKQQYLLKQAVSRFLFPNENIETLHYIP